MVARGAGVITFQKRLIVNQNLQYAPHQSLRSFRQSSIMALRKTGEIPLDAARKLAVTEAEALEQKRHDEARAAFEATFKKKGRGAPPTLPKVRESVRERPGEEEYEAAAAARKAAAEAETDASKANEEVENSGFPPGVADPLRCVAVGAGAGGGTAGRDAAFTVVAKDGEDCRVKKGGGLVKFELKSASTNEIVVQGEGKDWNDGTYGCSYSVSDRGDYELTVTYDGVAIRGSPFQAFFSASLDQTMVSDRGMTLTGAGGVVGICRDFLVGKCDRSVCKFRHAVVPPPPPPPPTASTSQAPAEPPVPEELKRTAHVSNLPNAMTIDHVKQMFSFCGTISEIREGGVGKNYAFIEFSTHKEVLAALALNGMNVGGRNIRVELAKTPKLVTPRSFTPPLAAMSANVEQAKAAQEAAAARAAEISKRLQAGGPVGKSNGGSGSNARHKPY